MTYYDLYCRDKVALAKALACPYAECPTPERYCGDCKVERLEEEAPEALLKRRNSRERNAAMGKRTDTDSTMHHGIGGLMGMLAGLELDGRDAYMAACGWLASGEDLLLCTREDIRILLDHIVGKY